MTSPYSARLLRKSAGFTLIEVLVVLALVTLLLGIAIGHHPSANGTLSNRAFASALASGLRAARSQAAFRNRSATLTVDLGNRTWRVDQGPTHGMPPRITLELVTVSGEVQTGSPRASIRFYPDGSSTGGRILLKDGGHKTEIRVDWLSSQVSVSDVR